MTDYKEIGRRITELREACDCPAEELAADLNLDIDVYRGYEENGENIPISVIFAIANKFNVDFTEILTGTSAKLNTYHIVRHGEGREIERYPGYRFQDLAFRYSHKIMQPLLVTLNPSDEPAALVTHSGQEFNLVLAGTVIVTFGDKQFSLNAGDSIYFNPTYPHGQQCGSDVPATFVTVIAE